MDDPEGFAVRYVGYDSFLDAMKAHAEERKNGGLPPQDWNVWIKEAVAIARFADIADSPQPGQNREFSNVRNIANVEVFGREWKKLRPGAAPEGAAPAPKPPLAAVPRAAQRLARGDPRPKTQLAKPKAAAAVAPGIPTALVPSPNPDAVPTARTLAEAATAVGRELAAAEDFGDEERDDFPELPLAVAEAAEAYHAT